jgi:cell fate (sporulation/competence/biofilm development) regulator YmcA (YheA/YmcA/DUF963 family)
MAITTAPTIDPAEHVRLVEAEYTRAETAMRQTEARLQQLDRQIAAAPGLLEDLQQQLFSLLSQPSDSAAYNRKVSEVQAAIRDTERLAEDRQAARGPLAQQYGQEQGELNQLQRNVTNARAGQLWAEFQETLLPLDAVLLTGFLKSGETRRQRGGHRVGIMLTPVSMSVHRTPGITGETSISVTNVVRRVDSRATVQRALHPEIGRLAAR